MSINPKCKPIHVNGRVNKSTLGKTLDRLIIICSDWSVTNSVTLLFQPSLVNQGIQYLAHIGIVKIYSLLG